MATGRVCKDFSSACVLGPPPPCLDSSSGLAQGNSVPAQLTTQSPSRTQALCTEKHTVSPAHSDWGAVQPSCLMPLFALTFWDSHPPEHPKTGQREQSHESRCHYSIMAEAHCLGDRRPKWTILRSSRDRTGSPSPLKPQIRKRVLCFSCSGWEQALACKWHTRAALSTGNKRGGQTAACACPRVIPLNLQPTVMCCC